MHRKDDGHFSGNGIDCSQKPTLDIRMALHLMHERGDSWELRARPGDIQNFRRCLMRCSGDRELDTSVPPIRHSREKSTTSMPEIGIHRKTWVK
jgi:hypothetical protein